MNDWFTTEKIDDKTWAISEYGHWEEVHSYLLIGRNEAALIDTGLGVYSIKDVVEKLTQLPVLVILTHSHWDHIGGSKEFKNIAIHEVDSDWLEHGLPISDQLIQQNFAKEPTTKALPANFQLANYTTPQIKPSVTFKGGEVINLGDRKLEIVHTPGHSPGSICIYDKTNGYLLTGDTLYQGTLFMNYKSTDPEAFANSVRQLSQLSNVKRILPGHHKLNIPNSILAEANMAFKELGKLGKLQHGSGLHKFSHLSVLA